ncbi:hypothetical protein JCM33374_g418 [Metschnikowia sp. JCM 33374]|nr:hypothetical protein JCM33374_g418 [Metschnikowia sp. JCM 33374]
MISTFVPVSDSFVVAGTSDSQIQVIQFPTPDPTSYFNGTMTRASPRFAGVRHATSTTTLGKCSFWPVNGMAHMDETVAAVSATTLSTWDLVKNRRVRHVTTPDHSTTCNYIGAKLWEWQATDAWCIYTICAC